MDTFCVTVSPKYQIVIPKELRERLRIRPGQRLFIYEREGTFRLARCLPLRGLRGMAKGLRWTEEDRNRREQI